MRIVFETAWGLAGAEADNDAVLRFHLPGCVPAAFASTDSTSSLLRDLEREVNEYFAGRRVIFTIPLAPSGTEFRRKVWRRLLHIPYGELRTYGDIAKDVNGVGASRAVGMACATNPIPLLIPCHRVIGAGSKLTGFSGGGIDTKRRLIEHEMGGLFARKRTSQ